MAELETASTVKSIDRLLDEIGKVSNLRQDKSALTQKINEIYLLFMELKATNRDTMSRSQQQSVRAKEGSERLASVIHQLNNLKFESNHYKREIEKHQLTLDMGALDLIPEDQFHAQYKKEIVKETDANPHFFLIKRLEFELSHRIALEDTLAELQARQFLMQAENNRRQGNVESLFQKITDIEKASLLVLRPRAVARPATPLARYLCAPLYTFYASMYQLMQLDSYKEQYKEFAIEIRGLSHSQALERFEKYGTLLIDKKDTYQRDPLSLRVSFQFHTSSPALKKPVTVMLDLFYFVQLHVVAVQAFGHSSAAAAIPIPIDHVLHSLYLGDDGLTFPGQDGNQPFNTALGRPFGWLQSLCGLDQSSLGVSSFKAKMDDLLTKIVDKVGIEMCLLFQFDFLSKAKFPTEIKSFLKDPSFTSKDSLVINSWTEILEDEYLGGDRPKRSRSARKSEKEERMMGPEMPSQASELDQALKVEEGEEEEGEIQDNGMDVEERLEAGPPEGKRDREKEREKEKDNRKEADENIEVSSLKSQINSNDNGRKAASAAARSTLFRYFKIKFTSPSDKDEYRALICIPPGYPLDPPIFQIKRRTSSKKRKLFVSETHFKYIHPLTLSMLAPLVSLSNNNKEEVNRAEDVHSNGPVGHQAQCALVKKMSQKTRFDIDLEIVQQEINSVNESSLGNNLPFLLSYQIRKLQILLDIVREDTRRNDSAERNAHAHLPKEGRLRTIPFDSYL